jgi:transposase
VCTWSSTVQAGLARRARIVLPAADGVSHTGIAERLDVSRQTVITPPKRLGVTHWSSGSGATLKIDHATVARAWKNYGV